MKMKFNLKEIDWKQLFLQRGEFIGLGIALAIAVPVLGYGAYKGLTSGSASANSTTLTKLASNARDKIDQSPVPPGTNQEPADSKVRLVKTEVDPDKFATDVDWFSPSSIEDIKRRRPDILSPTEWVGTAVEGGIKVNLMDLNGPKPRVMVIKTRTIEKNPKIKRRRDRLLQQLGQRGGAGGGGAPGKGGAGGGGMGPMGMGGGMGQMGGGMGQMGMGGMGQMGMGGRGGAGAQQGKDTINNLELMDLDKVKDDTRLAEELRPARMVILNASFPYKKQLEVFRTALRMRSLNDMIANLGKEDVQFKFQGYEIARRIIYPDGRVGEWEEHYDQKMLAVLRATLAISPERQEEDPDLTKYPGIINYGLTWPRPQLDAELGGKYPTVQIAGVKETIAKLDQLAAETTTPVYSEKMRKLEQKTIDPLDPTGTLASEAPKDNSMESGDKPPEGDKNKDPNKEEDPGVPENALVRIVDLTVKAGLSYEYKVRVRMANPNYNQQKLVAFPALARDRELLGDWCEIPPVAVPFDTYWYVLDEKPDRERALVQIHRWVDTLEMNHDNNVSVADWLILEKTPAFRGEYLGRTERAEVAHWDTQNDTYEMVRDSKTKQRARVPVDFSVRNPTKPYPALLIDYEGGKGSQYRLAGKTMTEDEPLELLVLTPEGRLVVHSSIDDFANNPDRAKRVEAWKKRIDDVKKGSKIGPKQPGMDKGLLPGLGGAGGAGGAGGGGAGK